MFIHALITSLVLFFGVPAANAQTAQTTSPTAEKFITSLADRAIATMANPTMDSSAKKEILRSLLLNNFDLAATGKFALGRYARGAETSDIQNYNTLYRTMLVEVYARRFSDYSGEKFVISGSEKQENGDILVTSSVKSPTSSDINIVWRVRNQRVVDVIVEGVSMAVTQRAEFASVIEQGGGSIKPLLAYLKTQTKPKG